MIKRANDTNYGLAAGVFTKDLNMANTISRALKAGTVWINTWNQFDAGVPFGGYKQSGIGREKGPNVLDHYTQVGANLMRTGILCGCLSGRSISLDAQGSIVRRRVR